MNYLFSVIIPVYNEEKTIGLLLSKLESFSSKYSIETIVIDSGSTDKTLKIINNHLKKNLHLKLLQIKKSEFDHSDTRNLGVRKSSGKYICFISGDAIHVSEKSFAYFQEDLESDRKVVAVFGKQIPSQEMQIIQKIELECRFDKLDQYTNKAGILIFDPEKPFIPITEETKFFWYSLFNPFACYKKTFLLNHPLPSGEYAGDLFLGKYIVENNLIKIYDKRCEVLHHHVQTFKEFYETQKEDYLLRLSKLHLKEKPNLYSKIIKILNIKKNIMIRAYYIFLLSINYLIKFIIIINLKLILFNKILSRSHYNFRTSHSINN